MHKPMRTERFTWFLGTSLLERGESGNDGCTGVILEKKTVESIPDRRNGSLRKA